MLHRAHTDMNGGKLSFAAGARTALGRRISGRSIRKHKR
jgi:hypothetical protein